MRVNLTYNNVSNVDKGLYLKSFPSFTFSNEKYNSTVINGRRGALITNLSSYDNLQIKAEFLILSDYMKTIRTIKQWLNGAGTLYFSDDESIYYDVLKITYNEESRDYYDRGTFSVTFICYPYQFDITGNTEISINAGYVQNDYDESYPQYVMKAGSGKISINGHAFTYSDISEAFIIDTRKQMVYGKESGTNYTGKTQGDFNAIKLISGKNEVDMGGTHIIKPLWGYSL